VTERSAPTAFALHGASPLHDTGWQHPEHQGRLRSLASSVGRDMLALHGRVEQVPCEGLWPADEIEAALLRVHTAAHVEMVRAAVERARAEGSPVSIDDDTRVSAASWDAALGSVEAAWCVAEAVARGERHNGFVATRPPGHHATPDRAMGFCLFNTVAVVARWLQAAGHSERVMIIDWDVHHGNGTQDVFWHDDSVFFASIHERPGWPGSGAADEIGEASGRGFTLNAPVPPGTERAAWLDTFEGLVEAAFARFEPDFVLVSAGYDALAGDPLGAQALEPVDFYRATRCVMDRAEAVSGGRLVACLEGGYDPRRTGLGCVATLRGLAGVEPGDPTLAVEAG
jgi:acetoin utilization deacetylase AcuC-like enzyme